MLDIEIDTTAVLGRIDGMLGKIRELRHSVGDEFASWQREDVHRQHAAVRRTRRGVATVFRPHSRFEMQRGRRFARRLVRKGRYVPRWSTRPILRPELEAELVDRMTTLLAEKIRW
jgi:hypothetical protein